MTSKTIVNNMIDLLFLTSLISIGARLIKEATEKPIPAENWANEELIRQDRMKGISDKEFSKNLANGKYKLIESYPEPHRDPKSGKIIIENCKLYNEDVRIYGAYQAHKWVKQGRYNLTPEELEKQYEEFKKKMEYLYSLIK